MESKRAIPVELAEQLKALGQRIRVARTRRKWRAIDLANRSDLSRTAVDAVERGNATTGIGTYVRVLWALGLNCELDFVADPGLDRDGLALEISVQTKRVHVGRKI